jgi:hypothetical protein
MGAAPAIGVPATGAVGLAGARAHGQRHRAAEGSDEAAPREA